MPSLSICIPTYGRVELLSELLHDIADQVVPGVEVVVADDASPDDTARVVESFRGRIPKLRIVRHETNVGMDENFLAVVAAASGDYVWLMGDDDRLEPGGVARVLASLERWPDVVGLTLGVVDYDSKMTRPTGVRVTPASQVLHGAAEAFTVLADLLGFISALVIRRSSWNTVAEQSTTVQFKNYYVQVYIVGRALGAAAAWGVVQEPGVRFRTENDQLQDRHGWVDRLRIDLVGYAQITAALFADDPTTRGRVDERLLRVHGAARILNAVTSGTTVRARAQAMALVFPRYWRTRSSWILLLPLLVAPTGLLRVARRLHKSRTSSGASRAASI